MQLLSRSPAAISQCVFRPVKPTSLMPPYVDLKKTCVPVHRETLEDLLRLVRFCLKLITLMSGLYSGNGSVGKFRSVVCPAFLSVKSEARVRHYPITFHRLRITFASSITTTNLDFDGNVVRRVTGIPVI